MLRLFSSRLTVWIGVFCAANFLDWLLTRLLVEQGGAYESNPLAARILRWYGWAGLALLKTVSVAVVLGLVLGIHVRHRRTALILLRCGCAIVVLTVGYSSTLLAKYHLDPHSRIIAQERERAAVMKQRRVCFVLYRDKVDELAGELARGNMSLAEATAELCRFLTYTDHDPLTYLDQVCDGIHREACLAAHVLRQAGYFLREEPILARRLLPSLRQAFASYHPDVPGFALEWFPADTENLQ